MEPATTDRGMWRVVAAREFTSRLRDRGFYISTGITLALLTVFIAIRAFGGDGGPAFDLGVASDADAGSVARAAVAAAHDQGVDLRVRQLPSAAVARAAVRDGTTDAALLVDGGRLMLVGLREVPDELALLVEAAATAANLRRALLDAGLTPAEIDAVSDPSPVVVSTLEPFDPNRSTNEAVAFVAVLLLYGQLFGYGFWVASGVIEEKASRIVEVLLAAIRARQLLAGKVVGIGILGLLQLFAISAYAIILAGATGALDVPVRAAGAAAIAIGWFVLGFGFYACLFAVSGSLVSRMEQLQNVIVPINLLILASFFISIGSVSDPDSTMSVAASLLPFSAALAMPVRIVVGGVPAWQIGLSLAILLGSVAALIPLAGRLYAGAVLRMGPRVRLRDAWRAGA
jgi:ABC-2 type transport system permease protein